MEISERQVEAVTKADVTVIHVKGQVNISARPERLQQLVRARLSEGARRFVVNLAECSWMDSTGLGELITSLVTITRQGGSLKLAQVPQAVRGILTVSNLTQVFEIYEDEQGAINSFAA
jgi:anti-sigma B factor antagonist